MLVAELNRSRRIGAEFEFTMPCLGIGGGLEVQRTIANVLSANGIRAIARGYCHEPLPVGVDIAVESDSSVRGESRWSGIQWCPVEIKTRILNGYDDWEQIVPKTLEIVKYLGARVNQSCGHHLHLSFDEVKPNPKVIKNLYNTMHKFEGVVFGTLAPSRKSNSYCQQIPASKAKLLQSCKTLECFQGALGNAGLGSRYSATNWSHCFGDSPRVEFRHHHGTLDPVKARHWLRTLLQLMQHATSRNCQSSEQLPNTKQSLQRLLTSVGLRQQTGIYSKVSPELKETGRFLRNRWTHFTTLNGTTEGEA